MMALYALVLTGSMSCGSERVFSGTWRQAECAEGDDCGSFLYELHLGRYGDAVTGMLVRYDALAPNSFDKPFECGCFVLAGGRATDGGLDFSVLQPGDFCGERSGESDMSSPASDCQSICECENLSFALVENGEELVGQRNCDGARGPEIRFVKFSGTVRNMCPRDLTGATEP